MQLDGSGEAYHDGQNIGYADLTRARPLGLIQLFRYRSRSLDPAAALSTGALLVQVFPMGRSTL